jgi:Holliday junction resolvase RusA-like endonuclease
MLTRPPEHEIDPQKAYAEFIGEGRKRTPPAVLAAHGGRVILRLPLPHPQASQNATTGLHVKKGRIIREMREEACKVALAARLAGELWKQIRSARAEVQFFVPDKRRRDPNNLEAACKAYYDGFVDAGLLYDDDRFAATPKIPLIVDKDDPRCEITIYEVRDTG